MLNNLIPSSKLYSTATILEKVQIFFSHLQSNHTISLLHQELNGHVLLREAPLRLHGEGGKTSTNCTAARIHVLSLTQYLDIHHTGDSRAFIIQETAGHPSYRRQQDIHHTGDSRTNQNIIRV